VEKCALKRVSDLSLYGCRILNFQMLNALTLAAVLTGSAATSMALLPQSAGSATRPFSIVPEGPMVEVAIREAAPDKSKETQLICKSCNANEQIALKKLQDHGIKDKNALATIMGNIRQESTFVPNICEGGARVPYHQCASGGYGLIQLTCQSRYNGLGRFAARTGGNPSSLDTQLKYIFTEPQWRGIENQLKTPGRPIDHYMRLAHRWLGWGHHGARTNYAHDYARRLTQAS
jgi:hypothetical protein